MRVVQTYKEDKFKLSQAGLRDKPNTSKSAGDFGGFYGTLASHVSFRKQKEVGRRRSKKETRVRKAGASGRNFAQGVWEQACEAWVGMLNPQWIFAPPSAVAEKGKQRRPWKSDRWAYGQPRASRFRKAPA